MATLKTGRNATITWPKRPGAQPISAAWDVVRKKIELRVGDRAPAKGELAGRPRIGLFRLPTKVSLVGRHISDPSRAEGENAID